MKEKEEQRLNELKEIDKSYFKKGYNYICGIDEAGRGPLAGPVVVAAVIMPKETIVVIVTWRIHLTNNHASTITCWS